MEKKKIKVGIIGLGLIGASLLKALYEKKEYVLYTVSKSSFNKAKKYSFSSDKIESLKDLDIIFISSKLSKTVEILDKLNTFLNKNTIVVDVASVKEKKYKKYKFNFILSHPMAGSEKSGFEASDKELFKGSKWLIEKNNPILEKIIKDTGAKPVKIDMKNHNSLCAEISHLPSILACLLFDCANDNSKQIASSGFRDMTRLCVTDSDILLGMYNNNKKEIIKSFNNLIKKFNLLKKMTDNEKIKLFEEISQKRAKMYDKNGKNIFKI